MKTLFLNKSSRILTALTLLTASSLGIACDEMVQSSTIETNQMYAEYFIVNDEEGLIIETDFRNQENTEDLLAGNLVGLIDMEKNEKIEIVQGEDFRVLYEEPEIDESTIQGYTLIKANSEEYKKLDLTQEIIIELQRPESKKSALASKALLPEQFEVTIDGEPSEINISNDDMTLTISGDENIERYYSLSAKCDNQIEQVFHKKFEGNTLKISKDTFSFDKNTCEETITIGKTKLGTVDPEFKGGSVIASQEVNVKIMLKK